MDVEHPQTEVRASDVKREARRRRHLNRHSAWNRFRREFRRDRRYLLTVVLVSLLLALCLIGLQRITLSPANRLHDGVTLNLQERILQRLRSGNLSTEDRRALENLTEEDLQVLRDLTGR